MLTANGDIEAQYVHPQLHEANEPRCLHGYALSQRGAQNLLTLFSDPWRAYQTPVDTFIPFLTRQGGSTSGDIKLGSSKPLVRAFSMEPPIIIQSKELASDIQTGKGSTWRGLLADSTWDRILRDEGHAVKQLTWEDIKGDPAIRPRPWGDWTSKKKSAYADTEVPDSPFEEKMRIPYKDQESIETSEESEDVAPGPDALRIIEQAAKEAQALAREKAIARPGLIEEEQQAAEVLKNILKKPAALTQGKKNNKNRPAANAGAGPGAGGGNSESGDGAAAVRMKAHSVADMKDVLDAMKKGAKAPKKGDAQRVGTGPMRVGRPQEEGGEAKRLWRHRI